MHRKTKTHRDTTDHVWCFRKGRDSTDLRTCLLSASSWHFGIKGRDSTDQNIFVISELLTRIITHHTSYTYTHLNSTDPRTTSPGWLSASSWHVCEFVTCRYQGSWKHGPEHIKLSASSWREKHHVWPQSCKTPKSTSSRAGCWHHHKNTKNTTTKQQSCKTPKSMSSRAGCWHHKNTTTTTTTPPPQKTPKTPAQKHHHTTTTQKHHDKTTILQNTDKYEFSGRMLTPAQHHHKNTNFSCRLLTPPQCEHWMCDHSMWDHSMRALYVRPL